MKYEPVAHIAAYLWHQYRFNREHPKSEWEFIARVFNHICGCYRESRCRAH